MDTAAGHSTDIIGGDTTASPSEIIISITLVGFVEKGRALRRDAAKAGDRVYVTGFLGDSHAGLMALSGKKRRGSGGYEYTAVEKHLAPCPRFNEGRLLLKSGLVDCCIDISDGIAGDLDRVCSQSGVGALIEADRLPVSYSAGKISADRNEDSIDYALYGGEDYELLFTVAEKNRKKFIGFAEKNCLNIFEAGIMTRRKGLYIKKGSRIYRENGKKIWKHF
ncbi:MAG: thiamine-phosphate kinase [Candidatus Goldiibacteriota bacterium]